VGSSSVLALLLSALVVASPAHAADRAREVEADSLARSAQSLLEGKGVEPRIGALRALDRATTLAPNREDLWLAYGRACVATGRLERALACFRKATKLAPDDAIAWSALGGAWKDDWLAHLDRLSLDNARACYERASRLAPQDVSALTALSALALLRGDPRAALDAGLRANALDPRGPRPMMALGAALFRLGSLANADSAFRAAQRHTDEPFDWRLSNESFEWVATDPDLTTPENEARLDYLTRLALVYFLFDDEGTLRWDKRAELFVRYGPPASVEFNPAHEQLGWESELDFHYAPDAIRPFYAPSPIGFPYDLQVWNYPDLGMSVELWDRFLTHEYDVPYSNAVDLDPLPDPAMLEGRTDVIALAGGRGVFHALAPGVRPFPLAASCARFPGRDGVRMLGNLRADAAPSDSVWGSWALADSTGHVVATETRRLDVSACEPGKRQVGTFAAELPPGDYRLDFSVWDRRGRRGVEHLRTSASKPGPGPLLSDLVLLCATSPQIAQPEAFRIEPDLDGRVSGSQLTFYCEIDGLLSSATRPASFAYRSEIFALDKKGRRSARPVYEASREEQNVGSHRRQFVTAPIRELAPGGYEFVLEVTDQANASTVTRTVRFVKDGKRKNT
jgi:Flp pilus assembly protein TadD